MKKFFLFLCFFSFGLWVFYPKKQHESKKEGPSSLQRKMDNREGLSNGQAVLHPIPSPSSPPSKSHQNISTRHSPLGQEQTTDKMQILVNNLKRFQHEDTKVSVIVESESDEGIKAGSKNLRQVLVRYEEPNRQASSFRALVNLKTGEIIRSWDFTIFENKQMTSLFLTPSPFYRSENEKDFDY